MEGTNADLKKAVGSAAYFVSAAQNANHKALLTRIQVDDGAPVERLAHVIVVGNVGFLQGNLPLIPDARPDDGLLDVLIASPVTFRDWARVFTRVVTRRHHEDAQLDRFTGRKVTITVDRRDALPARRRHRRRVPHDDRRGPARCAGRPGAPRGGDARARPPTSWSRSGRGRLEAQASRTTAG